MSDSKHNALALEKKAIKLALNQNWKKAIGTNLELLELRPEDKKAKMRLGRAYLQTKEYKKAESIFRKILRQDPINTIAKKNLELAKNNKIDNSKNGNPRGLIEEPGMTAKEFMEITVKNLKAEDFKVREELGIKINKASANIKRKGKVIGRIITPDLIRRLNAAKSRRGNVTVSVINGRDNVLKLLFRANVKVFKAERQEYKPYLKKGSISEPEVEMATTEETK